MDQLSENLAKTSLTSMESTKKDEIDKENADTSLCPDSNTPGNASIWSQSSTAMSQPTANSADAISSRSINSTDNGILDAEQEYTQFFLDKSDSDPNFINLVEQLSEIFPNLVKTDLKIRLKLSDNVEQLMEELFVESEQRELMEGEGIHTELEGKEVQASKAAEPTDQGLTWYQKPVEPASKLQLSKYVVETCQLQEIFPHFHPSLIEQALIKHNGDVDGASIDLLDPDSLKSMQTGRTESNAWKVDDDLISRVKSILDVNDGDTFTTGDKSAQRILDDEKIKFHICKCRQDYSETLKSIVVNCRPKVRQQVTIRNVGGRVQRGGPKKVSRTNTEYRLASSTYKYNPHGAESLELQHMYIVNKQLQMLDKSVLINALEFYEGDCDKVLQFAIEVLSHRSIDKLPTIEYAINVAPINNSAKKNSYTTNSIPIYSGLAETFKGYSAKRGPLSLQTPTPTSTKDISKFVSDSKLDLHGKTALEALALTKRVLDAWWQEEIEQRIEHGKLNLYGSSGVFVNNLLIVTGRGIHSANGVSIIRRYVKDHLVRNGYIFEEGIGNFEVQGLRKK